MPISNPLASPLFLPTLGAVGGLLGASRLLLAAVARGGGGGVLAARWRVWAVIAPIYALAVLGGAGPLLLLLAALAVQGLREYARLVGLPRAYARGLPALGALAPLAALVSLHAFWALAPVLLLLATLAPLLRREPNGPRHLAFAALGWGYVSWFLAHLMLLYRYVPSGEGVLLATGLAICLSDVAAFTVGKRFGRRKLAPALSPNKTWEGAGGNLLGAYLGIGLMGFALPADLRLSLVLTLPPVVAAGALWGDLFESSLKREFGVKDTGAWLPGFGGLLDRMDSLLLVGPLVYYVLRLATWLG